MRPLGDFNLAGLELRALGNRHREDAVLDATRDRGGVRLVGQAWKRPGFPKGYYYFARNAMTCCTNDIAPCGWVCKGERTPDNKTYFTLTARCQQVQGPEGQVALMLNELSTEKAKTPHEELVSFVNL